MGSRLLLVDEVQGLPGVRKDDALLSQQRDLVQRGSKVLGVNRVCLDLLLDIFSGLDAAQCERWGLPVSGQLAEGRFSLARCCQGMKWVVDHIVEPQTEQQQCAFVDLFLGLRVFGVPCVGAATDFHSYTWREPFCETVAALQKALPVRMEGKGDAETRFVWFDIFCQNQHRSGNVEKTFSTAIKQVERLLFSTPDVRRPQALGRVWCLFEVMSCIITPSCTFFPIGSFTVHQDKESVEASLRQGMRFLCAVEDAQASRPEDKDMVLRRIEQDVPGGSEAMNITLRKHFRSLYFCTILCQCAFRGDVAGVAGVLQQFEDSPAAREGLVNARDEGHQTALHLAAEEGHVQIVKMLLAAGAHPDALTAQHETPLHQAAMEDQVDVIRVLLEHGARTDIRDDSGKTPREVATAVDSTAAARILP